MQYARNINSKNKANMANKVVYYDNQLTMTYVEVIGEH